MAQRVILAARDSDRKSISTSLPPTIYQFLDARNATALQADYALAYAGHNIYLPTSFCQALLQGNILAIPYPDAPTGLSPLITPPSSSEPAKSQKRKMRVQILLAMVQDCLSKEEEGNYWTRGSTC